MPENDRRLITAEDLFRYRLVSDPRFAPDGERIVFVVQRTDLEKNRYFTNLWLVRADGGGCRAFTHGDQRDGSPRWSPDGRCIAFLSDRGEKSQVWRIPVDGGEAEQLTHLDEGSIGEFHWSPDGTRIAFTYRAKPDWARKEAREEREKQHRSTPPLVIRRLKYRSEGAGYLGEERQQIYVLDVASGALTQITHGESDQDDLAWAPDGQSIAFVTNRSADPDRTPQLSEIRVVPAGGGEERVIPTPEGPKGALAWSPDGSHLAYYGHTDVLDAWSPTEAQLWVVPVEGGAARNLSGGLDRTVGDATLGDIWAGGGWTGPVWAPGGRQIYFLVSDQGAVHVYRVSREGGAPVNLTPGFHGCIVSLSLDGIGRRLVSVVGDPLRPGDIEVGETAGDRANFRRVTDLNRELRASLKLAVPEEIRVRHEGAEVHGWLLRPPGEDLVVPRPLILYIHGGPHTQYGWCLMHEFQYLAAKGFAVLYTNPRGSRGYGQAHTAAIRGDWGGPDYRDLMAAVEHACTLPGIDGSRVGVTGGSYGGYMTNWLVGHTQRFKAAVTQRSVTNLHSMGGTCDFNFSSSAYFGSNTWDDPAAFLAQSPLSYADTVQTPLLIIHSEGDLRCPIEQAEQLFAALKCQGKVVEFVRYGREANHGLSRGGPPDLRQDRLERIAGWMERYLQPGE